jgi:hypothetical protein
MQCFAAVALTVRLLLKKLPQRVALANNFQRKSEQIQCIAAPGAFIPPRRAIRRTDAPRAQQPAPQQSVSAALYASGVARDLQASSSRQ